PKVSGQEYQKSSNIWSVTIGLKLIVPLMLILSVYLLLRGHNAPGGGFIGGLVAGLAWVLQERAPNLSKPFRLIFTGLCLSLASGLSSLIMGEAIFTAWWGPELFAGIKFGNVLLFDIGVFILVVGMVLMISRLLS